MQLRPPLPGLLLASLLLPAAASAQVDLEPVSMRIDASEVSPSVQVVVRNSVASGGTIPAGQVVELHRAAPAAGTLLATLQTTAALAPGQVETVTFALEAGFSFVQASGVARALHARVDPANALAESLETNNVVFGYRFREGLNPAVPRQHRVLVVTVNGSSYNAHGTQLANTVTFAGGAVTHQVLSANGQVADLIASNTYDQIWVYDLSSGTDNYPADWDAIAAWYLADQAREIIADGRIIASLWRGYDVGEGRLISGNYYHNLRIRGGGLMLGTDHASSSSAYASPRTGAGVYVNGINGINDRIGIGRFWGDPGGTYAGMPASDPNPLRNLPNNLAIQQTSTVLGIRSDSSPGNAPTGFQDASNIAAGATPLLRTFYTLAWHNGSNGGGAATPAVSTTIQGSLGFGVTVSGCRAVQPGQSSLLTASVTAGAVAPLTYEWTSNVSGVVGTAATLDTAVLPAGDHVLSLVVRDASGFRPGVTVKVSVGGPDCDASCTPDAEDIAAGRLADLRPAPNGVPDVCENQDGDGALDFEDPAPCDPTVEAIAHAPAANESAMALYEDLWPGYTDLDFNDAVVAWNAAALRDLAGNVRHVRLVLHVLALGGAFDNGLAVQLPVAASRIERVTRSIAGGPTQTVALRSDAQATFWISSNLREVFGGQAGPINSIAGSGVAPVQVIVDVALAPGTPLALGAAPWDLHIFRTGEAGRQIHFPQFGGTSEMNTGLFGRESDGSRPGRWFVGLDGLPYALAIPTLAPHPLEGVELSRLFPDVVGFAASGGLTNLDWYRSRVNLEHAFGGAAWRPAMPAVLPGPEVERGCLPAD